MMSFPGCGHRPGYPHLLIKGMKGYNGVAIASRLPLTRLTHRIGAKGDCRHLAARDHRQRTARNS